MKIIAKCGYFPQIVLSKEIMNELDDVAKKLGFKIIEVSEERDDRWGWSNEYDTYKSYLVVISQDKNCYGAYMTVDKLERAVWTFEHRAHEVFFRFYQKEYKGGGQKEVSE